MSVVVPGTRVLLVDDDVTTRVAMQAQLEARSCNVLAVNSGHEAERVIQTAVPIDVLVIDVALARVEDRSVARTAARRWPSVRVVFTVRELPDLLPDAQHAVVLIKPLSIADLKRVLGLDGRES